MDISAHKLLESATFRTLHAQNFSRSSSEAAHVLTDLLSRYLTVLSHSCKKYAEQAGRLNLTARDASCALEEMGVSIEELQEYCGTEGKELGRYAMQTRVRTEDLKEYKAALSQGLRQEYDSIPLIYAPIPDELSWPEDDSEEIDDECVAGEREAESVEELDTSGDQSAEGADKNESHAEPSNARRPTSPPLPLSPISNPASPPARKRQRTIDWNPPDHVPDFLPPFPGDMHTPSRTPSPKPAAQSAANRPELLPTPLTQALAPASSSDYLTSVPYAESSLSSVPEWHLPEPVSPPQFSRTNPFDLPTPQIQPSLLAAYHHILTHPPPSATGAGNPGRHKVAMGLLAQNQRRPRWDAPDTLFGSVQPNLPRVSVIMPSYPIPVNATPSTPADGKGDKTPDPSKDKRSSLPSAPPRTVAPTDRIAPMISQQASCIPELARQILPSSVYTRATRLTHPPVLVRGNQKLTYGPPMLAPWNSTSATAAPGGKAKDAEGQDDTPKVLPDAKFFATWDYEQKAFWEELGSVKRARTGSIQINVANGRTKSSK